MRVNKRNEMTRMKGSIAESPWSVWAVVIFVGIGVATIFFLRTQFTDYAAVSKTPLESLKSIESANAIRHCFMEGKPYVTKEFLDANGGKSVTDICGFSEPSTDAYVLDSETQQQWLFDSYVGEPDHSVWLPIGYSGFSELTSAGYALDGEFVIRAKWSTARVTGLSLKSLVIDLYPSASYPGGSGGIGVIQPSEVKGWIEKIGFNADDVKKVTFSGTLIGDVIPAGMALKECNAADSHACVRLFAGVVEMHMGRLYVDVST
jgi:hypothetical protein